MATFLSVLLFDLQIALYVGIALHALFFLKKSSHPDICRLLPRPDGSFREVPLTSTSEQQEVEIIQFEGALFFGAERAIEDVVDAILSHDPMPRVVIFRMKHTRHFDANFVVVFSKILNRFRARRIPLLFCGIRPELQELFDRSGLTRRIGRDRLFKTDNQIFESTSDAIQYAYTLLKTSPNQEPSP
jgi:SulP family sulfate permease